MNHGAAIIRPDQSLSEKMQELTEVVKLPMPEGRKKVIVARSSSGFHVGTWVLCDGLPLSDPLLILSEQSKQHTLPNGPALSPPA